MKYATLLLGLALCASAHADTVTLEGMKHSPGEVFFYDYTIQRFVEPTFNLDVLNGSVITRAGALGCAPCTSTIQNNEYLFSAGETIILDSFGHWELIDSPAGVQLIDPVATPEPLTLVLLFFGALWLWAIMVAETRDTHERREREYVQRRDYLQHHSFRKV